MTQVLPELLQAYRPTIIAPCPDAIRPKGDFRHKVLVLGIYVSGVANAADHIVRELQASQRAEVHQEWYSIGHKHSDPEVAKVTVEAISEKAPKFELLNRLLAKQDLSGYDYVVVTDDDILLPAGFLDILLEYQAGLGYAMAQPARTANSHTDLPIVERQHGVLARTTWFVEIGPIFCVHKSAFELVFPFDLRSPLGWGHENVWSLKIERAGMTMGIIDAVPVDHSMRKPVQSSSWQDADRGRTALLTAVENRPLEQCFAVHEILTMQGNRQKITRAATQPKIGVIIPTYKRAELIRQCLESLAAQTLPKSDFEVVVVSDGSPDNTEEVCAAFEDRLQLSYARIENSGTSAAKNLGIFIASAPILFFFDDDDAATPFLLNEHLQSHKTHDDVNVAVLGRTEWDPSLKVNELMHYVMQVKQSLFCYPSLQHGKFYPYTEFWSGRSSCRRTILVKGEIHRQEIRWGYEDVELGYRLAKFGLRVVYNKNSLQHMIRGLDYKQFASRSEKLGYGKTFFAGMYPHDEKVIRYCGKLKPGRKDRIKMAAYPLLMAWTGFLECKASKLLFKNEDQWRKALYASYVRLFYTATLRGVMRGVQNLTPKTRTLYDALEAQRGRATE